MRSNSLFSKLLLSASVVASVGVSSCNNNNDDKAIADTTKVTTETAIPQMMTDTSSTPIINHAEAKLSGVYADTIVDGTVKFDRDSSGKVKMIFAITIPAKASRSVAIHIHEHGD